MSNAEAVPKARVVVQQCLSARLQVKPPSQENEAEYVEVGRGIIIYVCFLKGATEDLVEKMVRSILAVRLSESEPNGKLVSVLDLPGDVLIVPQVTFKSGLFHCDIRGGTATYVKICPYGTSPYRFGRAVRTPKSSGEGRVGRAGRTFLNRPNGFGRPEVVQIGGPN
ncbi:DTD2 [Branchiostoma lanceolatum]|uniref:D-aminoacyl-tRNA deacylase n=1 Tax=Branchiostoma lanceolatum TaxID=7740 RepID=A0A8J9ZVM0_BRALA|nr:DTD2 [Branchiostoma lanceolatum]